MAKANRHLVILEGDGQPDELFVSLKASGIDPLVAMIDGLPTATFKGRKTRYIAAERALDWQKREQVEGAQTDERQTVIESLEKLIGDFRAGRMDAVE